MPIYEYECRDCGHVFDALQKMSDQPLTDCPDCGKAGLRKLLSAPNFRLKGGGWYETDFKDKNKRNLAGGEAPAATKGEAAAGKSGDGATSTDPGKSGKSGATVKSATAGTTAGKSGSAGATAGKSD